ncbi:hypothetical protein GCM10010371_09520 [Streptomyces subrutilus]|uniref:Uncharacterized protein n=1 Tax=Streptomyces subrutilus TaxID=36818 RepID=A0A918QKG9_9ACTN|nr:hypothetical protein GCM10010371_09520 [Streptomyces subrutilus]
MICFTVGEGEAEADGEADAEADAEGEGEAPPGLSSVVGEASGEVPAVGEAETGEAGPADSDFCGPQAVAASATAVTTPSVRIMALWRCIAVPRFLRRVCR